MSVAMRFGICDYTVSFLPRVYIVNLLLLYK